METDRIQLGLMTGDKDRGSNTQGMKAIGSQKADRLASEATIQVLPRVFDYLDYRIYLQAFYSYKKAKTPSFSLAVFSDKAGLTTRNYLKRVIDGERPLSSDVIPKFCLGLGLNAQERVYFEALVNFNQTQDPESKKHYFSALKQASLSVPGSAVEIAHDQFEVYGSWYILPIRELVLLKDFQEDASYISKKLKSKISKKEAAHAMDILQKLGLLVRDEKTKKLRQSTPVLRYDADVINMVVRDFHRQTLDRTKEAIAEDEFNSWDLQSLSLAIPKTEIKKIHEAMKTFVHELNVKFSQSIGAEKNTAETVILLNTQVIEVTK